MHGPSNPRTSNRKTLGPPHLFLPRTLQIRDWPARAPFFHIRDFSKRSCYKPACPKLCAVSRVSDQPERAMAAWPNIHEGGRPELRPSAWHSHGR